MQFDSFTPVGLARLHVRGVWSMDSGHCVFEHKVGGECAVVFPAACVYLFKVISLTVAGEWGRSPLCHRAMRVASLNGKSIMSMGWALERPSGFNSPIVIPPFCKAACGPFFPPVNFQRQTKTDRHRLEAGTETKTGCPRTIKLEAHF